MNKQYASIGSDNDLATNKQRVIIWTKDGVVYLRTCESLGLDESNFWFTNIMAIILLHRQLKPEESLRCRHNGRDIVSNHQPHDCLLNHLFKAQIKENIKTPRHWPLCGEFTCDRWIPRTKGQ